MFKVRNGSTLTDGQFSLVVVQGIMSEQLDEAVSLATNSPDARIKEQLQGQRLQIKLHLISLQAASYYLLANLLSDGNRPTLEGVAEGFLDAFAAIYTPNADRSHPLVQPMYELMGAYGGAMWRDFAEPEGDNPLALGTGAELFADNICGQCGIEHTPGAPSVERSRLMLMGYRYGLNTFRDLAKAKAFEYQNG